MTAREIEQALPGFEGLIHETARQIVRDRNDLEHDEIAQRIRIKVWGALQNYNRERAGGLPLRNYVFMCVRNLRKDIEKAQRRYVSSIDELRHDHLYYLYDGTPSADAADRFDARYLCVTVEQAYAPVEDQLRLPAALTAIERQVIALRLQGRLLLEIDRALGLSRVQRERILCSAREKLAHLQPRRPGSSPRSVPTQAPPGDERSETRALAALAA